MTPKPPASRSISSPLLILKNIASLSASAVLERLLALFSGIFARRALGPIAIGAFSWAAAVASYPALIVNGGFGVIARRDLAHEPNRANGYVGLVLSLQFLMVLVATVILAILAFTVAQNDTTRRLLLIQIIGIVLLPLDFSWLLMAFERMAPLAIVSTILALARTALIIFWVRQPEDVFLYALITYPFQIALGIFAIIYSQRHGLVRWGQVRPTLHGGWSLFSQAVPIGLTTASALLYYNSDAIILGATRTDQEVGVYTTAYGLMLTTIILNGAVLNSYLPSLARCALDGVAAKQVLSQLLRTLVWIGFPLAAFGWGVGRYPVTLLYGSEFAASGIIFEWLSLNVALMFFNVGYTVPLQAMGYQKQVFYSTLIAGLVNVVANILLIPLFGVPAAIATTLFGEFVVLLRGFIIRRKLYPISVLRIIVAPLLISVLIAGMTRFVADAGFWIVGLALGMLLLGATFLYFEPGMFALVKKRFTLLRKT